MARPKKRRPAMREDCNGRAQFRHQAVSPWNKIGFNGILISLLHFVFVARFIGKPFHTFPIAL
jgi:hypothetical protein